MGEQLTWCTRLLGELAEFRNGVNFDRHSFGKGVKIVGVRDFQDFLKPRYEDLEEIDPQGVVNERHLLQDEDIIFVRSNGNRELIGRSLYIEKPPVNTTHSAFTIRLRFNSREAFPRFFAYMFRTPLIRNLLTAHGGGTNISNLTQDILKEMKVPLPPLSVQKQIASILSAYDDLIEGNTRRIQILGEMAKDIYRAWFVDFHFPGSEGVKRTSHHGREIPEGWEVRKLGDAIELMYGKGLKSSDRIAGLFPVYGSSGIVGYHDKALVEGPGVIVGRKGNVGSVFWSSDSFFPIDTVFYVRTKISLPYVYYNLQLQNFLNKDAAVPGLGRMQAYLNDFIIPPSELLQSFETTVWPLLQQIHNLSKANSVLAQTRDFFLPKIFLGEIDLTDLDTRDLELNS